MSKLNELIEKFKEDKSWNTKNKDGSHRFDEKIAWIEKIIIEYSEYFHLPIDKIVEKMESSRTYSWPNYYQENNFPSVSTFGKLVGIYETFDEFNKYAQEKFKGFKCPKCGNIGKHPQECDHRINKDNKCDWCSYGLFSGPNNIIILENGFKTIPILEPIFKD